MLQRFFLVSVIFILNALLANCCSFVGFETLNQLFSLVIYMDVSKSADWLSCDRPMAARPCSCNTTPTKLFLFITNDLLQFGYIIIFETISKLVNVTFNYQLYIILYSFLIKMLYFLDELKLFIVCNGSLC